MQFQKDNKNDDDVVNTVTLDRSWTTTTTTTTATATAATTYLAAAVDSCCQDISNSNNTGELTLTASSSSPSPMITDSAVGLLPNPPLFTISDDENENGNEGDGVVADHSVDETVIEDSDDVQSGEVARGSFVDSTSVAMSDSPPDLSLLTALSGVNEMDNDDDDDDDDDDGDGATSRSNAGAGIDPLNDFCMYDNIFAPDSLATDVATPTQVPMPTDGPSKQSSSSMPMSMPDSQRQLATLTAPPYNSYRWWASVGQRNDIDIDGDVDVDGVGSVDHQRQQLHQQPRYSLLELDNDLYYSPLNSGTGQSTSHHMTKPATAGLCDTSYQTQQQEVQQQVQHLHPYGHQQFQAPPSFNVPSSHAASPNVTCEPYSVLPEAPAMSNDCYPRYSNLMSSSDNGSRMYQYWRPACGVTVQHEQQQQQQQQQQQNQQPPVAMSMYQYPLMPSSMSLNVFGNGFQTTTELLPTPSYFPATTSARQQSQPSLLKITQQGETLPLPQQLPAPPSATGMDTAAEQVAMNTVMERLDGANSLLNLSLHQQQKPVTTYRNLWHRSLTPPPPPLPLPLTTTSTSTAVTTMTMTMTTCLPSFTSTFGSCSKCIENTRKRKPPVTVREMIEQRSKEKVSMTTGNAVDAQVFVPSAVIQVLPYSMTQPLPLPLPPAPLQPQALTENGQIYREHPIRIVCPTVTPPLTSSMVVAPASSKVVTSTSSSSSSSSTMCVGEVMRPTAPPTTVTVTSKPQMVAEVTNRQESYRVPIVVVQAAPSSATTALAGSPSVSISDWKVLFNRAVRPPATVGPDHVQIQKVAVVPPPPLPPPIPQSSSFRLFRPKYSSTPIRPVTNGGGQTEVSASPSLLRKALLDRSIDLEPQPQPQPHQQSAAAVRMLPFTSATRSSSTVAGADGTSRLQQSHPCIMSLLKSSYSSNKRLLDDKPVPNKSSSTAKPNPMSSSSSSSAKPTTTPSSTAAKPNTSSSSSSSSYKKDTSLSFRSQTYEMDFVSIGTYKSPPPCNPRMINKFKVVFSKKRFVYEFMVPSVQLVRHDRTTPHLVTIDVPFDTVNAVHCNQKLILVSLTMPPALYVTCRPIAVNGSNANVPILCSNYHTDRHLPTDITGDQLKENHLHKIHLQNTIPDILKLALERFDSRFTVMMQTPILEVVEVKNTVRSCETAATGPDGGRPPRRQCIIEVIHPPSENQAEGGVGRLRGVAHVCSLCHCQVSCRSYRCSCMKARIKCGRGETSCYCKNCDNPLNLLESLGFNCEDCAADICLVHNIVTYKGDLVRYLERSVTFPCCGHRAKVKDCIPGAIRCPNADCKAPGGGPFKFSWCEGELQDEKERPRNHCSLCRSCQGCIDLHCSACRRCNPLKTTGSKCPDCRHPRDTTYTEIRDIANVLLLLGRQDKRRQSTVAGRTGGRTVRPPQVNQQIRSSNVTTTTSVTVDDDDDDDDDDDQLGDGEDSPKVNGCSVDEAVDNGDAVTTSTRDGVNTIHD